MLVFSASTFSRRALSNELRIDLAHLHAMVMTTLTCAEVLFYEFKFHIVLIFKLLAIYEYFMDYMKSHEMVSVVKGP